MYNMSFVANHSQQIAHLSQVPLSDACLSYYSWTGCYSYAHDMGSP